jgi:ArsR family transcriptional regulator, arsenate/arsenite/antimonite-responsive transcriptional repressor
MLLYSYRSLGRLRLMIPKQREFGSRMFAALASPARLHILEFLASGPASVKEIAEATDLKQSMTSQHLSVLFTAGVVVCTAEGNLRIYSLRGPRIARILELVEEFYDVHLENLRSVLEQHTEERVAG